MQHLFKFLFLCSNTNDNDDDDNNIDTYYYNNNHNNEKKNNCDTIQKDIFFTNINNDNNNNAIENIQKINDDHHSNDGSNNDNKKTKTNCTMMSISDLQYTLDEILNMNSLFHYATNIEGSKLIQYLLENEENNDNNNSISNTTFYLFNKQLLNKDNNGNTFGMLMCCNIYGNYVMQKYLSVAPFYFVDEIITQIICPNAYKLAFDKHGSRVLQHIITNNNNDDSDIDNEHANAIPIHNNNNNNKNNNDESGINLAMKKLNIYSYYILYYITSQGHLIKCIENVSVNHIIQKCVNYLNKNISNNDERNKMMNNVTNEDQNKDEQEASTTIVPLNLKYKLFDAMLIQMQNKLYEFSLHKYGCRIIQSLLDFGNAQQKNFIIYNLIPYLLPLSCDKYGNYVMQKIIFYNRVLLCNNEHILNDNNDVMSMLIRNFYQLCLNKYGSNVAELCYQYSNDTQKQFIIQQLTNLNNNNENNSDFNGDKEHTVMIISLIKHEFGNYVIQKIINLSNEKQKHILLKIVKKNLSYLKNQIGKHPCIKLFIKNFFPSFK